MKMRVLFWVILLNGSVFAESGSVLQSIPTPGNCPTGLTTDGTSLWIADRKTDLICRCDIQTGKVIKNFPAPGYFPTGLTWDGKHLWVADLEFQNTSTGLHTGKLYQMDPKTGQTLSCLDAPGSDPQGLCWDGHFLWMSDEQQKRIYQLSTEDGTTINEFASPANAPHGLAWENGHLWISDRKKDEIYRVHPEKGIVLMILKSPGHYPRGLTWLDNSLWNVDYESDRIYKIEISSKTPFVRSNPRHAHVEYTHQMLQFGPGVMDESNIYIAVPENRDTQQIESIRFESEPDAILSDQWGQKVAHFISRGIKPGEKAEAVMHVEATIWEVMYHLFPEKVGGLAEIPAKIKKCYLGDGSKFWKENEVIQRAVAEAVGDEANPYWIARNIFDYLRVKMHYELAGGWNVAPTVLARGSGSCSEYSFVYISMCRAAGLPARYVGSVVVRGDDACMDDVFHRWVEVYLPNYGWVPVDPSGGDQDLPRDQAMYFGRLANRFLITTEGGGGSDYLGWDYNSTETWTAMGPVNLRIEKIADWEPMESD